MAMKQGNKTEKGQATVELVVAFPLLIVVAVIAVNAMLFFSDCAAFDRVSRETVRVQATSPVYGQGLEQSKAAVEKSLASIFDRSNLSSHVAVEGSVGGHTTFIMTLEFVPTLFGLGLRSSVLGVALPCLEHTVHFTVDCYKPGVLL